jgi:exoribonuclease R
VADLSAVASTIEQVSEARRALIRATQDEPARWWTGEELRQAIQNGFPSTVVSVALNDLVESDQLRLDNRLRIQYGR